MYMCISVCRELDMGSRSYLEIQFRVIHIGTRSLYIVVRQKGHEFRIIQDDTFRDTFVARMNSKNSYMNKITRGEGISEILCAYLIFSCYFTHRNKMYISN